jgi:hypothetical protein
LVADDPLLPGGLGDGHQRGRVERQAEQAVPGSRQIPQENGTQVQGGQRPILNFAPRGEFCPLWVKLSPGDEIQYTIHKQGLNFNFLRKMFYLTMLDKLKKFHFT